MVTTRGGERGNRTRANVSESSCCVCVCMYVRFTGLAAGTTHNVTAVNNNYEKNKTNKRQEMKKEKNKDGGKTCTAVLARVCAVLRKTHLWIYTLVITINPGSA